MNKPSEIRIEIANPCSEDWNKMTPCEQGRYCSHCKKEVIDFTAWSDAALYNFFATRPQNVCGRMLVSQTQRAIHIPPQPHSRLYRMVVAMGLALLAAQPVSAQNKPQMSAEETQVATGRLTGKVVNGKREPIVGATIQLFKYSKPFKRTVTDTGGYYAVDSLFPGYYDTYCYAPGFDSFNWFKVIVPPDITSVQNFRLVHWQEYAEQFNVTSADGYVSKKEKKLHKERERKERKAAKKDKRNNNK